MLDVLKRISLALVGALLISTATSYGPVRADSAADINADVNRTLSTFFRKYGYSRDLANRARAILVFPSVIKAGIGIGGEYGEGALRVGRRTAGYYNLVSASIGFQLGAQSRSIIIMFMTEKALRNFRRAKGWEIGVDGSVTLVNVGAAGTIDTNNLQSDTIGFVFGAKGLMYNLSLEGSKISHIRR